MSGPYPPFNINPRSKNPFEPMPDHRFMIGGKRMCNFCGGKGYELAMGEELCGHCAGIGRNTKSTLLSQPCLKCQGKGRVTYCRKVPCRGCDGRGTST